MIKRKNGLEKKLEMYRVINKGIRDMEFYIPYSYFVLSANEIIADIYLYTYALSIPRKSI